MDKSRIIKKTFKIFLLSVFSSDWILSRDAFKSIQKDFFQVCKVQEGYI